MDPRKNKVFFGKKQEEVREMASLTKIMTCYVSICLASEFGLDLASTWFLVSKKAAEMGGTSANLQEH